MSIIRMSRLGKLGRAGNMVIEAAFIYTYARRSLANPELPRWFGDSVFELPDAHMTDEELPTLNEIGGRWDHPMPPSNGASGFDYQGYCQFHASWYAPDKEFIQRIFTVKPEVVERFSGVLAEFSGHTVVGIHIRRGDYGQLMYHITPIEWYKRKIEEIWPTLENPLLFISSEEPALTLKFADYDPVVATDFISLNAEPYMEYQYLEHDKREMAPHQLDFFPDFYLLSKCDIMLAPNSTFSYAAAMISPTLREMYRSDLRTQKLERIDPWNDYPLRFELVQDYPNVQGVALETNPYWSKQPGGFALRRPK